MPGLLRVLAERELPARSDRVYAFLSDYLQARPRILTPDYLDYRVEEGGTGVGTVVTYRLRLGGRERACRLRVEAPAHNTLVERDSLSSQVTTWRVMPAPNEHSILRVVTEWRASPGLGGLVEGALGPRQLRRVYEKELRRLEEALSP